MKPIIVLWSELGHRFYATRAYKQKGGFVEVTGEKFDVTDQIAAAIEKHEITFKRKKVAH